MTCNNDQRSTLSQLVIPSIIFKDIDFVALVYKHIIEMNQQYTYLKRKITKKLFLNYYQFINGGKIVVFLWVQYH